MDRLNFSRRAMLGATLYMASGGLVMAAEPARDASAVVNERMRLYNAHQIEPFLALYAPDVVIYDYPAKPMGQGIAHLRGIFEPMFGAAENRVEIKQQIVMGDHVINDELVHYGQRPQRYVSIYEVRGGLIRSVRFVR